MIWLPNIANILILICLTWIFIKDVQHYLQPIKNRGFNKVLNYSGSLKSQNPLFRLPLSPTQAPP